MTSQIISIWTVQEFVHASEQKKHESTELLGLCGGNPLVTRGVPTQRVSNVKSSYVLCDITQTRTKQPSYYWIGQNSGTSQWLSLQWRHNERDSVSNHQPHHCLLNCLFRRRSKKTSKPRVTGLSPRNWPVTRKMFPFDDVIMGAGPLYRYPYNLLTTLYTNYNHNTTKHNKAVCMFYALWYE